MTVKSSAAVIYQCVAGGERREREDKKDRKKIETGD